jgi:hypothetical protein
MAAHADAVVVVEPQNKKMRGPVPSSQQELRTRLFDETWALKPEFELVFKSCRGAFIATGSKLTCLCGDVHAVDNKVAHLKTKTCV